jgi:hypothetical protein
MLMPSCVGDWFELGGVGSLVNAKGNHETTALKNSDHLYLLVLAITTHYLLLLVVLLPTDCTRLVCSRK